MDVESRRWGASARYLACGRRVIVDGDRLVLDNTLKRDLTVEASSSRIRRSRLRERILLATFDLTAAVCSSLGAWWVWSRLLDRELLPWHPATLVVLTLSWAIVLVSSRKLNSRLRRSILDDLPTVLGRILVASMVVALGTVLVDLPRRQVDTPRVWRSGAGVKITPRGCRDGS